MSIFSFVNMLLVLCMSGTVCFAKDEVAIPPDLFVTSGLDPAFIGSFSLFLAIVLLWTLASGKIFKKILHLPVIAGQIIGGMLLGPSLMNIAQWGVFAQPLYLIEYATGYVYTIVSSDLFVFILLLISSALTVSYLLWIAGHETDIKDIWQIGLTAVTAGILGAFLPIVMTYGLVYYFFSDWSMAQSIALGLIFSATSVSIPVAMLFAYNKMHLRSSKATLGAAVIDDILAVILLSLFFICVQSGLFGTVEGIITHGHSIGIFQALLYMVISFVVILSCGYFIIPPLISGLKKYHHSHLIAPVATGIMLMYFAFAELVGGLAGITGAYFAGLFHRMGDKSHRAEKVISPFVNAILLPLFLGSIGLQVNIALLRPADWITVTALLIVSIISKLIGCWFATGLSNIVGRKGINRWSGIETFLFGSSMVARGEVGLVVATILYGSRIIEPHQYVIAVVVIVLTTIAAPVLLALGFSRLSISPARRKEDRYALNIGIFPVIGTAQLFNIIIGRIESEGIYKTSIRISEGRKIVNIEGQDVKIILCPEEGILLRGNKAKIEEILQIAKRAVGKEVERLTA